MLWFKALHIISVICWFAGIFYLPRLFVYHAQAEDRATREMFKVMERKLYRFVTPFGILTIVFGSILSVVYWPPQGWLMFKVVLALLLVAYHFYCGYLVQVFARDANTRSHKWYRLFNELPVLALFIIVFLVVFKPF